MAFLMVLGILVTGCPTTPGPQGPPGPEGPPGDPGDPGDPGPGPVGGLAPGLVVTIDDVQIPGDRRPLVNFTAKDDRGNLLAKSEITDLRLVLAYLDAPTDGTTPRYVSYVTSTRDGNTVATYDGARLNGLTQLQNGTFQYRFATAIPAGYSTTASHQIGGQFSRVFGSDGVTYRTNAVLPFRPDGGTPDRREVVETDTCNKCHTRLQIHGSRREVQYCILCHNRQTSNGDADMAVMVHKIHRGAGLPSVVGGGSYELGGHDYSEVVFPQDIRNCAVCHSSDSKAIDDQYHLENPTKAGCGSCHDRTWFDVGTVETPPGYTNHSDGEINAPVLEGTCGTCHTPSSPGYVPIDKSHVLPAESDAAPGLNTTITSVSLITPALDGKAVPTQQVRINFSVTDKDGNGVNWDTTGSGWSCAATLAYPAPEYQVYARRTMKGGTLGGALVNNGDGTYTFTFTNPADAVPTDSTDTYAVALDARRTFTYNGSTVTQGTSDASVTYFTVDGSDPAPRREIVDEAKCNNCHYEIRAHGLGRVGVEYCVMCHNPNVTDEARRTGGAPMPPETVNFKDMLHSIHTGADLEEGLTIYGFTGPVDFGHVVFPGLRQDCEMCHLPDTYSVPTPDEALSTIIKQGGNVVAEVLPQSAACTSCHDGMLSSFHAMLNSDPEAGVETCAVCHGSGKDFDVEALHQLAP